MSNDKEIRIRAVLDASTFDKGINEIQEKIKKISQQQTQGAGAQQALGKDSIMGKYAQQAFGDFSKDSQRQLEQMYQIQRREAVNQSITMKGKEAELAKLAKADGEMTKQQKERVELLKKEIDLLKEKQRQTLLIAGETQKALDKMKPQGGGAGGGEPPGGQPPPQDPANPFKNVLGNIVKTAGVAAIAKFATDAVMTGVNDFITRDRKIASNNAASFRILGNDIRENMAGRGSNARFYGQERRDAMASAAQEQGRQSAWDTARSWGGTALQGVGGAAMLGLGWTGLGFVGGAAMFGAGTALKGGLIGDERSRAAMFDREKFNAMNTREGLEKYQENLAANIARDPRKAMAREYFEQNRGDITNMQKQLGLFSDKELLAGDNVGLLQRNMKYGGQYGGANFSQETIQQQIQALAAGGAMTSGMQDLSGAAATYNRQFNLNNAGQVMGRIQGNTGANSSITDIVYQRLLTEAVRSGVDASKMPRELERMTQMTAELVTGGGVDAQGMSGLFAAGLGGYNQKAMESAAGAAQEFLATSKESGGWQGQMGYGYLQSDDVKKKLGRNLSATEMNYLNQTSASELDEAGFNQVAGMLGTDVETAKSILQGKDKYKQTLTSGQEDAAQALASYFKENNFTTPDQQRQAVSEGPGAALFGKLKAQNTSVMGARYANKSQAEQLAYNFEQANVLGGISPSMTTDQAGEVVQGQKKRTETRAGYVEEGSIATGDAARMNALLDNAEAFKKAAKANTEAAEMYATQFRMLLEATKNGTQAMDKLSESLNKFEEQANSGSYMSNSKPRGGH